MWKMITIQGSLLFLIEDSGNDLNASSVENQLNQFWLIYTMDQGATFKNNEGGSICIDMRPSLTCTKEYMVQNGNMLFV